MNAAEARSNLVMDIVNGHIKKEQAEKRIIELEKTYGSEAFTYYGFEKKEKPWSLNYYDELRKSALAGAGSKEFILYLSEVKDYIENKNNKGFLKRVKSIVEAIIEYISKNPLKVCVAILAVIVLIIIVKVTR